MLSSLTEAGPHALAQACRIETKRLHWIMHGHPPQYSEVLALIPLGLAAERRTQSGRRYYAITDQGRKKARQLTARTARRAIARAATAARTFLPIDVRKIEVPVGMDAPAPVDPGVQ